MAPRAAQPALDTPHRYAGAVILGVVVGLVAGLALGLVWHLLRQGGVAAAARTAEARLADAQTASAELTARLQSASEAANAAETARAVLASQLELLGRADAERQSRVEEERQRLAGTFAELSAEALQKNNEQFLALAETKLGQAQTAAQGDLTQRQQAIAQLLGPLSETLIRYEQGLQQIEVERKGAYEGLSQKVAQLTQGNEQLQRETRNLVTALRSPQTRGRWGEIQLRRVVEMAGMLEHCDFDEQVSKTGDEGRLRPDMIVHMPGGRDMVVDAKVPLEAFLQLIDADDDDARALFQAAHARQLRAHVDQLSKKEYWKQFERSPQQVVAFIPGDQLLSAAYESDPTLQEHAMSNGVLLTTPTMLIALLRTVAFGWQQETLAESAREVQKLGAELYDRLRTMTTHMQSLQRSLTASVEAYNKAVGSLETRVLVTARRFPSLGVKGSETAEIAELSPIEAAPRLLQALDLVPDDDDVDGGPAELPEGGAAASS
jgi:DNA recombination protein RmuC